MTPPGPTFGPFPIIVTNLLPRRPTPGEEARRLVRHGMADILDWLGEDVGPAPDAVDHFYYGYDLDRTAVLFASAEMAEQLASSFLETNRGSSVCCDTCPFDPTCEEEDELDCAAGLHRWIGGGVTRPWRQCLVCGESEELDDDDVLDEPSDDCGERP